MFHWLNLFTLLGTPFSTGGMIQWRCRPVCSKARAALPNIVEDTNTKQRIVLTAWVWRQAAFEASRWSFPKLNHKSWIPEYQQMPEAYLKKEKGTCGHDIDCDIRRLVGVCRRDIVQDGRTHILQLSNFEGSVPIAIITLADLSDMGCKSLGLAIPINSGASVLCLSWSYCPKVCHDSFFLIWFTYYVFFNSQGMVDIAFRVNQHKKPACLVHMWPFEWNHGFAVGSLDGRYPRPCEVPMKQCVLRGTGDLRLFGRNLSMKKLGGTTWKSCLATKKIWTLHPFASKIMWLDVSVVWHRHRHHHKAGAKKN